MIPYQIGVGRACPFGQGRVLFSLCPQPPDGIGDGVHLQLVEVQLLHRRINVGSFLELVRIERLLQRCHRRVNGVLKTNFLNTENKFTEN